jgi:hypothetical protein
VAMNLLGSCSATANSQSSLQRSLNSVRKVHLQLHSAILVNCHQKSS